jgi:hypothetical protein
VSDVIAFDLRAAGGSPTGVGRYLRSIVQAVATHDPHARLRVYVRDEVDGLPAGVEVVRIQSRGPLWHARVWWDLRRRRPRAYCSTSLLIPALTGIPCLPVILDVISFLFPEHHMRRTRLFERLLMGRVVKRRPLIAGSETTLKDLDRLFGPVRAVVVPPWVPAAKSGSDERAAEEGILAPRHCRPLRPLSRHDRASQERRDRGTGCGLAALEGQRPRPRCDGIAGLDEQAGIGRA